jgi:hypothetical protein
VVGVAVDLPPIVNAKTLMDSLLYLFQCCVLVGALGGCSCAS